MSPTLPTACITASRPLPPTATIFNWPKGLQNYRRQTGLYNDTPNIDRVRQRHLKLGDGFHAYDIGQLTAGGSARLTPSCEAEKTTGGSAVTADANGAYSLSVDSGSWRVYVASDKYSGAAYASNPVSVSGNVSSVNIALTGVCQHQRHLDDFQHLQSTASGSFEDTTVKTKVTIDSGALGQTGFDSYITAKETVNYPNTPIVNVIANKAKDISAYSGSQVKNLSTGKTATIELTYTAAELAASGIDTPAEVAQLSVSTVNDQKEWESLNTSATYYDSSGNAMAASRCHRHLEQCGPGRVFHHEATHFSPYALTQCQRPDAPQRLPAWPFPLRLPPPPDFSWSANSESDCPATMFYRSTSSGGSFALLATLGAVTTYTNTGLSAATNYYYKIVAYDTLAVLSRLAGSEATGKTMACR